MGVVYCKLLLLKWYFTSVFKTEDRQALSWASAPEAHTRRGNGTCRERELSGCSLHKHSRAGVFSGSLRGKEGSGDSHEAAALNS